MVVCLMHAFVISVLLTLWSKTVTKQLLVTKKCFCCCRCVWACVCMCIIVHEPCRSVRHQELETKHLQVSSCACIVEWSVVVHVQNYSMELIALPWWWRWGGRGGGHGAMKRKSIHGCASYALMKCSESLGVLELFICIHQYCKYVSLCL